MILYFLLLGLFLMPMLLLIAAHLFAVADQNRFTSYLVVLRSKARVGEVVGDHRTRFGVRPEHVFDEKVKAYVGLVPTRHVKALRADSRVLALERHEGANDDSFLAKR